MKVSHSLRIGTVRNGKSDKVYMVAIMPRETSYDVICFWGRRGSALKTTVKDSFKASLPAFTLMNKIMKKKISAGYAEEVVSDKHWENIVTPEDVIPNQSLKELFVRSKVCYLMRAWSRKALRLKESQPAEHEKSSYVANIYETNEEEPAICEPEVSEVKEEVFAVCEDNFGIEDSFEIGTAYVITGNTDGMMELIDRVGNLVLCTSSRFRFVTESSLV